MMLYEFCYVRPILSINHGTLIALHECRAGATRWTFDGVFASEAVVGVRPLLCFWVHVRAGSIAVDFEARCVGENMLNIGRVVDEAESKHNVLALAS
jgi:hypothetical protein